VPRVPRVPMHALGLHLPEPADADDAVLADADAGTTLMRDVPSLSLALHGVCVAQRHVPPQSAKKAAGTTRESRALSTPTPVESPELLLYAPALPAGMRLRAQTSEEALEWYRALIECGAMIASERVSLPLPGHSGSMPLSALATPRPRSPRGTPRSSPRIGLVANQIKHIVSKKKTRFVQDGFDLDLAYITPHLIAMGFPAMGAESLYRNPAQQVREFLSTYHSGVAKVYNLCAERTYDAALLGLPEELVEQFAAIDHNPCPLFLVPRFCRSMHAWLDRSEEHVAAIHCKAGKGRTGMLICAFLVWSREFDTAAEALSHFGQKRTSNGKGVTIPSQRRYVEYSAQLGRTMPLQALVSPPILLLSSLNILNQAEALAPSTYFTIELAQRGDARRIEAAPTEPDSEQSSCNWKLLRVFDSRKAAACRSARPLSGSFLSERISERIRLSMSLTSGSAVTVNKLSCEEGSEPAVVGDVKVAIHTPRGKLCQFWFHTSFVKVEASHAPYHHVSLRAHQL